MKAVVLVTFIDCENKWRSLQAAGHEVHTIQYDNRPHDRHHEIVEETRRIAPDFTVFIGAVEFYHSHPVLREDTLCRLREIAPLIHMCNDAGDPPWWATLESFHAHKCFDVQVNIDGALDTPISRFEEGMTLLTPIDSRVFHPLPWEQRQAKACLCGGMGYGARGEAVGTLQQRGVLDWYDRGNRPYEEMAEIMSRYQYVFCHPMTGSGERTHVKGRVIEAGFAGAALIELDDKTASPTGHWFSGDEYFSVRSIDEAEQVIRSGAGKDVAARFHERVVRDHHPGVFWNKVLEKALQR